MSEVQKIAIEAIRRVRADGALLKPGEAGFVNAKFAKQLIKEGSAKEAELDADGPDLSPEERAEFIAEAVKELGDDGWTKAGTPKAKAVSAIVDFDVSADELKGFQKPDPSNGGS